MEVKILDLTRQYELLREELEPAMLAQMGSGSYIMGPAVADFEQAFAQYSGAKHAIAVNSGTDALVISLRALGIGPGDEVITTPFTFFATAEAIAMVGATPVFVDVRPDTYNLDLALVEAALTPRTKALMPVHIFGQPVDLRAAAELCKTHGLFLVEDACQAVGAAHSGHRVGELSDFAAYSFFPTKNLGAFGDAGMLTTNDEKLAVIARALREHGMAQNGAKARFLLEGVRDELEGTASPDGLYNPYKYYNYLIAYNSRMDALQATVLSVKLPHLPEFQRRRAEIAACYTGALADIPQVRTPVTEAGATHVWHQYALCTDRKDALGRYLAERHIGTGAFYPVPLHRQKAFENLPGAGKSLPVAEALAGQTVCLPIYPELRQEEVDYVAEAIHDFFRKG